MNIDTPTHLTRQLVYLNGFAYHVQVIRVRVSLEFSDTNNYSCHVRVECFRHANPLTRIRHELPTQYLSYSSNSLVWL